MVTFNYPTKSSTKAQRSNQNSLRRNMASLHLIIAVLLNAIATISSQCPQDSSAQDILCTVSRNDLLPPPTFALVHCETDRPGGLLLKQADALRVDNTRWRVDLKACFFRHGDNCTHLFIRIDSPPTQQQVEVCRIQDPTAVCTCIDLTGKSRSQVILIKCTPEISASCRTRYMILYYSHIEKCINLDYP